MEILKSKNLYTLPQENSKDLIKIISEYINFFKILHRIDPVIATDFQKKQEHFFIPKNHNHSSQKDEKASHSSCCGHKLSKKIYIPKNSMNNIEKNLNELHSSFFYQSNIEEMLTFLSDKYEKIKITASKQGLSLDEATERDFLHRFLLEGITCFYTDKLKEKLKQFEESISEQPMLLAYPTSLGESSKSLTEKIPAQYIDSLVNTGICLINSKIYDEINEYELFNQFKYLFSENNFEDSSLKYIGKNDVSRTDFIFRFHFSYFKKTKFDSIYAFAYLIRYLPYELNKKFSNFALQTNDYIQAAYYMENCSYLNMCADSSFEDGFDTGKKITAMLFLFPDDLELSRRKIIFKFQVMKREDGIQAEDAIAIQEISITQPLSLVLLKSRLISYQIDKQDFPFIVVYYFMHGPVDKKNFSC